MIQSFLTAKIDETIVIQDNSSDSSHMYSYSLQTLHISYLVHYFLAELYKIQVKELILFAFKSNILIFFLILLNSCNTRTSHKSNNIDVMRFTIILAAGKRSQFFFTRTFLSFIRIIFITTSP